MPIGRHELHRLTSFSWRGSSRCGIVTLLKLYTTTQPSDRKHGIEIERVVTNSERSMISKPFAHNMAILAFKKIRSYDSKGRKKSYGMILISGILVAGIRYTHPIDTEPLRTRLPQTESRTKRHRSFCPLIDLANNRLEHAEYTIQLDAAL